jgi:hypothetical protein
LIDQIFDLEATEPDSLASIAQARGGALRFFPVESGLYRHEFSHGSPAAGYYNFRPVLDLVEKFAPLLFCFECSDFPHECSPAG